MFPLVLVVILAGLLLGGALAHFFGGTTGAAHSAPTAVAAMPSSAATPAPILTSPPPTATPAASPTPGTTPVPTATPTKRPTLTKAVAPAAHRSVALAVASGRPGQHAAATSAPVATSASVATSAPVAAGPAATSQPVTVAATNLPVSVVRSYLAALQRGDRAMATTYLASGLPTETFINAQSRIESVASQNLSAHQYQVNADVQTPTGEYYLTFTVEQSSSGLLITSHTYVKI